MKLSLLLSLLCLSSVGVLFPSDLFFKFIPFTTQMENGTPYNPKKMIVAYQEQENSSVSPCGFLTPVVYEENKVIVSKNYIESLAEISSASFAKIYTIGQKITQHKPLRQCILVGGNMLATGHLVYGLDAPFLSYAYALKWLTVGFLSSSLGIYNTYKDTENSVGAIILSLSAGAAIGFFGAIAAGHIK